MQAEKAKKGHFKKKQQTEISTDNPFEVFQMKC